MESTDHSPSCAVGAASPRWRRPLFAMALVAVLLVSPRSSAEEGEFELPSNPLQGRLLFEQKRCYECHRFRGEGSGPDLENGNFRGSFLELGSSLWNHVPGMSLQHEEHEVPWPTLDAAEIVEVLAFLYYLDYLGRPGDAARGAERFRAEGCASCHEPTDGRDAVGPSLAQLNRFASPLYVAQAIWNHGPSMLQSLRARNMAPPHFQEGDLADIAAHLRQREGSDVQERVLLSPGDPNSGRELFALKGCAKCHEGGSVGGAPSLDTEDLHFSAEALAGTMWNHALEMNEAMRAEGIAWPEFSTSELADLIAFLYFLPFADEPGDAARGKLVFVSRSCADCHGGQQPSSHPGPELTGHAVAGSPAAMVAAMWNHAPMMKEVILEEGRPWPRLTGDDLRDLLAYLGEADQTAAD